VSAAGPAEDPGPGQAPREGVELGPPPGPGGADLLSRAVALAGFRPGARVLDVGCGAGRSVELLRRRFGLKAAGLDADPGAAAARGLPLLRARGERLPVADGALDGVLLECVLSVMAGRAAVLSECVRALSPGGRLIVADLFARGGQGEAFSPAACGASFLSREALVELVERQGLRVECCEDRSEVLREYLFRFVMERGPVEDLLRYLGGAGADPRATAAGVRRLGYLLLLAVKRR